MDGTMVTNMFNKETVNKSFCQCKDGIPGPWDPPGNKGEMGMEGRQGHKGEMGIKGDEEDTGPSGLRGDAGN